MLKLYGYFRSSAAYRVRIALNLKGLDYAREFVHLSKGGGQQFAPSYMKLNPQAQVPTLLDGAEALVQSLAIIEYLEEKYPDPPLLPTGAAARAQVRGIALAIACDIHPLNNLRVLNYLTKDLGHSEPDKLRWYRHWIAKGFEGVEALLADNPPASRFCHGDRPTLADICLVPQVANARRFDCPLDDYPTIARIADHCRTLKPFIDAAPENQPDRD